MNYYYDSFNRANQYFSYGYYRYPYEQSNFRQFPTINPSMLMNSAKEMKNLMSDANNLLTKLTADKHFSSELMNAAQQSKHAKVENMIKSREYQEFHITLMVSI